MSTSSTRKTISEIQSMLEKEIQAGHADYHADHRNISVLQQKTGYSRRQLDRLFRDCFGLTFAGYVKALILSTSAQALAQQSSILQTALDSGYESQEAFSRAFKSAFGLNPGQYRKQQPAIALFEPHPAHHVDLIRKHHLPVEAADLPGSLSLEKGPSSGFGEMSDVTENSCSADSSGSGITNDCNDPAPNPFDLSDPYPTFNQGENRMTCVQSINLQLVHLPDCQLIFLPSRSAHDYFSFCAEQGCDWEALLDSIPEKLCSAAIITLPPEMVIDHTGSVAAGILVPTDYDKPLPDGYQKMAFPAMYFIRFFTDPVENPDDFGKAIALCLQAAGTLDPELYGCSWVDDQKPFFNFGLNSKSGSPVAQVWGHVRNRDSSIPPEQPEQKLSCDEPCRMAVSLPVKN